jgi:metal-responsive CopG/Arc/MetJ family transcriptional regulator
MAVVNFTIPARLESNVQRAIHKNGFASKAEFFRMAAVNYLKQDLRGEDRIQFLVGAIAQELRTKYKGKKIPPVEEQLKDIL